MLETGRYTSISEIATAEPDLCRRIVRAGQPLNAHKYFIILPHTIDAGKSAKPSDDLHANFSEYNYNDPALAQYRLLTEGLGLHHPPTGVGQFDGRDGDLDMGRDVPGFHGCRGAHGIEAYSNGRSQLDAGANVDRNGPPTSGYMDGNYVTQSPSLRTANVLFSFVGTAERWPSSCRGKTHDMAERYVDDQFALPAPADANNFLYQWNVSTTTRRRS
jgi:homoserine O-acetyltransferase/O-succinyltransferase